MAICMKLGELEDAKKKDFKGISGTKETKLFIYQQKFVLHFKYIHQVDDHKNGRQAPIFLDRTWVKNFCPD